MEDIAVDEAEAAFEVERREHLPGDDCGPEIRRMPRDGVDDQIGEASFSPASSQLRPSGSCGATCCTNRLATCLPGGASVASSVEGISISTTGSRDQPCARASR